MKYSWDVGLMVLEQKAIAPSLARQAITACEAIATKLLEWEIDTSCQPCKGLARSRL